MGRTGILHRATAFSRDPRVVRLARSLAGSLAAALAAARAATLAATLVGALAGTLVGCGPPGPGAPAPPGSVPPGGAPREPLVLKYVANAGVLLSAGDEKVLIDALFDRPNPAYRSPAPEVLDALFHDRAPYDGVDLVLVTHDHPDHFAAPLAARYLAAIPGAVLVAPVDAVAALRKTPEWNRVQARVVALDLAVGETRRRDLDGAVVTATRTLHGAHEESPVNFSYDVAFGGWRVFHEGDPHQCRNLEPGGPPLDLVLTHVWFPLMPGCRSWLQELDPGHIGLMHVPKSSQQEWRARIDQVRGEYPDVFLLTPGMRDRVIREPHRPREPAPAPGRGGAA